ncbi:hypothetical protein [Streptomyces litmocidini]|uniref:Integral membrane protein n=1 Tax=Streptomyces litmocidini TaxID=67318 RepID=A0ABW7UIZ1_9ACTN
MDDDRLRMTDDFAAITSAAIALILTLGFVEMGRSLKDAQTLANERLAAVADGASSGRRIEPILRSKLFVVLAWTVVSLLMATALMLTFLWAAIDGHGPARWLAWYILIVIGLGLGGVLLAAVTKSLTDFEALHLTYWRSQEPLHERWERRREEQRARIRARIAAADQEPSARG